MLKVKSILPNNKETDLRSNELFFIQLVAVTETRFNLEHEIFLFDADSVDSRLFAAQSQSG